MKIQDLLQIYAKAPQARALAKGLEKESIKSVFLQGLVASAAPVLFASVAGKCRKTILFILQDADEAGYFYHDLTQMLPEGQVLFFPSSYRRQVKYAQRDAANEILRTEVLGKLLKPETSGKTDSSAHTLNPSSEEECLVSSADKESSQAVSAKGEDKDGCLFIVSHPEALSELVISKRKLDERTILLQTGQTYDVTSLEKQMRELGFQEVDYVYEPGQFAVRGSIVDVFSFSSEYPFRVDFFGDEIDSIRTFEVQTQLSRDKRQQIEIVPELASVAGEKTSFMSFLPKDTVLVMKDFLYVRDVIDRIYRDGFSSQAITERMEDATEMEQHAMMQQMKSENMLVSGTQFTDEALSFRRMEFGTKPTGDPKATIRFDMSPQPLFHKNFELLTQTFEDYILRGYRLYVLADSQKQNQRLHDIFEEINKDIVFTPVEKTLHGGFTDNTLKACFFTDHQIFDRFHKYSLRSDTARSGKVALTMKELQEMEPGDYIVHVDFGIGQFGGLVRVPLPTVNSQLSSSDGQQGYQEVIRIIYQHGDKVDVSIHSLYKISKYKRRDSEAPPRLSTLGTGAWERMKERTKTKIKDIARDLIRLYAARRREKGFAFSADSFLQHELEASFLYEDTPDQLKATNDVKADMESSRPMDRLVCGDVGFGKTEVAVRAAFKAACDSKQTAVLVPTTVLAYQHFQTFKSRLKGMPVRVDYLSRARSAKQTKEVLADLAAGKIDILIGTHKLIGKAVKWKDLGLLIIDEEQKFGVTTKEKLRKMKTNVDTLTMSATPIPRTLQFSLMGARDMSIIQTPPPNRYPINTEIHTFDSEIIAEAINFEMSRNGQVFFVNDNIKELPHIANIIHKYVPDCRVAVGHGQMKPEELEKIVMGFMNYDYDLLLSTTIVENGIDISNANTIIINDAHRFGLSDLHQMRGRVGRSNKKAFCYLLAPPLAHLNQEARRRLEALETFSELGSGFNLSMQDLDIRGAGNLLGAEQSGFMEELGYETYLKILKQAMAELANEAVPTESMDSREESQEKRKIGSTGPKTVRIPQLPTVNAQLDYVDDCAIESDIEMYFSDQYVPNDAERMLLYRELDNLSGRHDLDVALEEYRSRLKDRFGDIPDVAEELIRVVPLRVLGKQLGVEKIMLKQQKMFLYFVSNTNSPYYQSDVFGRVLEFLTKEVRRCNLREINGKRSMVVSDVPTVGEALRVCRAILSK